MKFFGDVGRGLRTNQLDFGGKLDQDPDPGFRIQKFLLPKGLFPLRLRCAARCECDRYRNADSVSISIATRSAAISFTIAAPAQRSRCGNTL